MPAGSGTPQVLNDNITPASDTIASLHQDGHKIIIVSCIMCALASACVLLRFAVKATGQRRFGLDDILVFGALASYAATEYLITAGVNMGLNASDYTSPEYSTYLKMTWIYSLLYWTTITFATLSILFLYQRIFAVQRSFAIASRVLIGLTLIWWISGSLCEGLSWQPTHSYWELNVSGRFVIAYQDFWIASMVAELAIETAVLVLPVWEIAALLMNVGQRVLLIPLFCSGGLVLITGVVRIQFAWNKPDMIPGTMWLSLHSSVAIISACLPTYGPILKSIRELRCSGSRKNLDLPARTVSPNRPEMAIRNASKETSIATHDHREGFEDTAVNAAEHTASAV